MIADADLKVIEKILNETLSKNETKMWVFS